MLFSKLAPVYIFSIGLAEDEGIVKCSVLINSKIDRINSSLQKSIKENHAAVMSELERHGSDMEETLDIEVSHLQSQMQVLEEKINSSPECAALRPKRKMGKTFLLKLSKEGLGNDTDIVDAA